MRREYQTHNAKRRRLHINSQQLDKPCSRHFTFRDIIYCGETVQREGIDNVPLQPETWEAIAKLAQHILDPVVEQFGSLSLTYGFCSHRLGLKILKNRQPGIAPKLDQHAGYELNSKGHQICSRGGQACDFTVLGVSSSQVAAWVVKNCPFDRLYFYGDDRPVHVSYSCDAKGEICWLTDSEFGRRQPRRYTVESFLQQLSDHDA